MKILLTGGSGRLGKELKKLYPFYAPSRSDMDITRPIIPEKGIDLVIHAAAWTDVAGAEVNREKCHDINVTGTQNVIDTFDCPIVYISSEYANKPTNYYAETKAAAERLFHGRPNSLIIRTLFKVRPFPYDTAYTDQWTQGDYVDVIACLIMREISNWDRLSKMVYVGTGRKTMFDLAKQSKPDIRPISIKDIKTVVVPGDYL